MHSAIVPLPLLPATLYTYGMKALPPYVVLNKIRGETPLEAIGKWKAAHSEYANVPAAYAGRLDPMAEGKLLVLLGEECKKLSTYTKLDKVYEIEVLLDLSTDTGDVLGMPTYESKETHPELAATRRALSQEIGTHDRQYPIFSSKTVQGKPLFLYALEGTIDEIEVPSHPETIYSISLTQMQEYSEIEIAARIREALAVVPRSNEPSKVLGADFRQDAVRAAWEKLFACVPERTYTTLSLTVTCGSGAYMRTLADRIAVSLGTRGLALSINRTKLGSYSSLGPFHFWSRSF